MLIIAYKPEAAILSKVEVFIVVHRVVRFAAIVVNGFWASPMLELQGILGSHKASVLMEVLQVVVDLRTVEFTCITQSFTPASSLVLLWHTTIVES